MYSYVVEELRDVVAASFPVDPSRAGIFGHSMGGHGALTIALKNPQLYKSVSAFAPICLADALSMGRKGALPAISAPTARDGANTMRRR